MDFWYGVGAGVVVASVGWFLVLLNNRNRFREYAEAAERTILVLKTKVRSQLH